MKLELPQQSDQSNDYLVHRFSPIHLLEVQIFLESPMVDLKIQVDLSSSMKRQATGHSL